MEQPRGRASVLLQERRTPVRAVGPEARECSPCWRELRTSRPRSASTGAGVPPPRGRLRTSNRRVSPSPQPTWPAPGGDGCF